MNKIYPLLAVLACSAPALSQTVPQQAAAAVSPEAPVPAVPYHPLQAAGASALVTEGDDWKAANATVGQYPRGHADIVKWEKAQPAPQEPRP